MKRSFIFPLAALFLIIACQSTKKVNVSRNYNAFEYKVEKKSVSQKGAVVSAHALASKVGVDILKMGGNAVDAAIATQLALAVVYPGAGNIGGGGFMVARLTDGKSLTLDYREKAPEKAGRDMYLDEKGNPRMTLSQEGHLAAGVPGTIAGLFAAHEYANLPFSTLIQPAIELAEKGFAINASEAEGLNENKNDFLKLNTRPTAFVHDTKWKEGDTLIQTELAATLKRISRMGKNGFYKGKTARFIVAEMKRGRGIISKKDLRSYTAQWRDPMEFDYKGHTILTMPLPSSGGVLLPQMMKMVEERSLGAMGLHSVAAVQLMTEVERRAYADRAKYLGDPDYYKVPVKTLISREYLQERMKDFSPDKAGNSTLTKAGQAAESEETTHLSVYDGYGNAVAVTTTLNGGYGSKTVVGGAGFLLNNEMDDFSVKPGVPNMYGAIGAEANAIVPGKRMLSSMSPTIVLKEGKPYLITGTPGGTTIITSVFQTLVNMLEFGLDANDAVNKPKFHHQWFPDVIFVEKDFPASSREQLEKMGYKITIRGQIGRTELIKVASDGKVIAVADKRGDDHAEGYE